MPLYEFKCGGCGVIKELLFSISEINKILDEDPELCPEAWCDKCGGIMHKKISVSNFLKK